MKYCTKCKVSVAGQRKYCPLCQDELQGIDTNDDEAFPEIPTMFHQNNLIFRLLIFISVAISIISAMLNILIPSTVVWSLFVVAGIACFWISMAIAFSKRRNIPNNILHQVVIISVLAVIWDFWTNWHGWSFDYIIPIACLIAMLSMAIISKVRRLPVREYLIYLVIDGLFGIVPVIFILTGLLHVLLPSLICIAGSLLTWAALMLFEGDNMYAELKRRLHV